MLDMTLEQLRTAQENHLGELISAAGSEVHLSKMISVNRMVIMGWVKRKRVSKNGAKRIEKHPTLGVKFKAKYLRPDL